MVVSAGLNGVFGLSPALRDVLRPLAGRLRATLGITGIAARLAGMEAALARLEPAPLATGPAFAALHLPDGTPYALSVDHADAADVYQRGIALGYTADMGWRLLMQWLRPGDVFFDLGANVGVYSIPAAMRGAVVHGFELLDANIRHFVRSVERNELAGVRITLGAVWDRPGCVGFKGYSAWGEVVPDSLVSAATIVIDDYVAQKAIARVDAMKIDVEGSERRALAGMAGLLARDHPDILIESNALTCGFAGYACQDMLGMLADAGYALYRLHDDRLCPWPADAVQEIVCADYFASTGTVEAIAARSGWAVAPMTTDETIASVLAQDGDSQHHSIHAMIAVGRMPAGIADDPRVAAMVAKWRDIPAGWDRTPLYVGLGLAPA